MSKTLRPATTRPLRFTPARTQLTRRSLSIQDLRPRHDSSAEVYTCAHTPRSPTFRLPSPTPSTCVCVRPPIISPVLGLPHSRARLLSTYSSAEVYTCAHSSPDEHEQDPPAPPRLVYTCAHSSPDEHEQDPPATKTLSIQALRPRHDSSAEVHTCAHTPRSPTFRLPSPTPSTRVCVRPPIISPVLGLPDSRAPLLSTYSSAEVYTCAHSSPDEHEQDPPAPPRLVR
ncbi:hypothetical protein C8Q76DRAFT_790745 [Earliella scabrosa]|nr:hypothetical protein C8Q76DRAFT_790745 [Earliella scabrosa]